LDQRRVVNNAEARKEFDKMKKRRVIDQISARTGSLQAGQGGKS